MTSPDPDLAGRYGSPSGSRRLATVLGVVIGLAFLGWLAWATWFHATPEVTSRLGPWKVVDQHTVEAVVEVDLEGGAEDVSCRLEALASDHSVVGVLDFEPVAGRNEVTVTTEREATSVERVGCTADGQPRPR